MKDFVSLAVSSLILFFADICQWNKMSGTPLFNGPFLFTSISVRTSFYLNSRWMWHCVCACHKRRAADKKGVPRTVKTAQVRTSFCSEWSPGIQSVEWIRIRAKRRMFVCLSHRLWVHLVAFPPTTLVEQRIQTEAEGAVCNCVPEGFGFITRRACVCTVVLRVHHCSFFQFSQEILCCCGRLNTLKSTPYFVAVLGNGSVIKMNPVKVSWEKKNAITVFSKCCECLLELAPRTSWGGFFQS